MQKIMTACLSATNTTTPDGIPCEYTWIESSVCDDSFEYDGDVRAYLENTLNEPYRFLSNVTIHDEPEDVIVIGTEDGIPLEIYWAEPAYWYAVQVDNDGSWDGDGSTNFDGDGSFDWDEAYTIADEKAYQNPDSKVEIATIDNPFYNPFCIDCYTVQERKIPDELLLMRRRKMERNKSIDRQLGQKIKILMQTNRIGLTALAAKMKISPQLLYYRLNKGYRFSVQELHTLAPLLDISEEKLIEMAQQTIFDNQ